MDYCSSSARDLNLIEAVLYEATIRPELGLTQATRKIIDILGVIDMRMLTCKLLDFES